ncbi:MAG: hypothetical protein CM1200mP20_08140 [Pseudomonadota bacterium]|nr:MAG: hypothetical protein CM1200mP20_08140 [Pseudomonadota bacterium]
MISQFLGQERVGKDAQDSTRLWPPQGRTYENARVMSEDIDDEGNWWLGLL